MNFSLDQLKKKKIGVLLGGLSAEREISLKTGAAIQSALERSGYRTVAIDVGRDLPFRLREEQIDVAFIALHGRYGEDGVVQGVLELLQIPYTGPGVMASSVAMNKLITKHLLRSAGIATPAYLSCHDQVDVVPDAGSLGYPLVVKPVSEGSSLGVAIVERHSDLAAAMAGAFRYEREILLEQYIPGREITASVLNGTPLPLIEICPAAGFYSYQAKYTAGETDYLVPAPLAPVLTRSIQSLALASCRVTDCCQGAVRVDFRLSPDAKAYVIEINTIPGMTATSLLPKAAAAAGMGFEALIETIVSGASLKCRS
ncbi:MAG: D-alanine--D-alanine ligase [Deltaproteobacteria bacterium]|nr:D-alanine--D-alanine ligase [Candidatus Anaeroferrophillus wilburensis]MBN2888975.1 D-alanine--D-alanine ligase [Deltaproteobacteria bacterium]